MKNVALCPMFHSQLASHQLEQHSSTYGHIYVLDSRSKISCMKTTLLMPPFHTTTNFKSHLMHFKESIIDLNIIN